MARRSTNSVFEDVYGIAAALPWWVGVVLAIVTYMFLHRYAVSDVPTNPAAGQLGQMVVGQMVKTFSTYLQYLLPLLFLAGAGASYLGRKKREQLLNGVGDSAGHTLNAITWREFELLVGEAFRLKGYTVVETGGGGADGGVDLTLKKGAETFLVQCKQWRALKVSVSTVRELYGVMAARGAAGGFVVTSGTFTRDAKDFAEGRNIDLMDGSALKRMIDTARLSAAVGGSGVAKPTAAGLTPENSVVGDVAPPCPKCGGPMTRRIAKQGIHAGKAFWGCNEFPSCRGIRGL